MKVILLENIKGVGFIGDLKEVSDGYARNFLFPRSMAKPATPAAVKDIERLQAKRVAQIQIDQENARKAAEHLEGKTFEMVAKANEQGTLFDGIEASDILNKIKEVTGMDISSDSFTLEENIKSVGEYPLTLTLVDGVEAHVTISVKAE